MINVAIVEVKTGVGLCWSAGFIGHLLSCYVDLNMTCSLWVEVCVCVCARARERERERERETNRQRREGVGRVPALLEPILTNTETHTHTCRHRHTS